MRILGKITAICGIMGAIATTSAVPASALDVYIGHRHHHGYYDYGGGWDTYNGCRPGWTVQGGNCAPYKGPRGPFVPPGARYPWQ